MMFIKFITLAFAINASAAMKKRRRRRSNGKGRKNGTPASAGDHDPPPKTIPSMGFDQHPVHKVQEWFIQSRYRARNQNVQRQFYGLFVKDPSDGRSRWVKTDNANVSLEVNSDGTLWSLESEKFRYNCTSFNPFKPDFQVWMKQKRGAANANAPNKLQIKVQVADEIRSRTKLPPPKQHLCGPSCLGSHASRNFLCPVPEQAQPDACEILSDDPRFHPSIDPAGIIACRVVESTKLTVSQRTQVLVVEGLSKRSDFLELVGRDPDVGQWWAQKKARPVWMGKPPPAVVKHMVQVIAVLQSQKMLPSIES